MPKSWAQVVAPTGQEKACLAHIKPKPKKKEDNAKANEARAKYELTLTAKTASSEVQRQLREHPAIEITKRIQRVINSTLPSQEIKINGIKRLGGSTIRVQCKDPEHAQKLQNCNADWGIAYTGLQIHKVRYGIVAHGIAKGTIDFNSWREAAKEIEEENANRIQITEIGPLRHRGKATQAAHESIVIYTGSPAEADACIKLGIIIANEHHDAEKYAPHLQITQCFKCHRYDGHKAAGCMRNETCGRCGEEGHNTTTCEAKQPCCPNCKGPHPAWHAECKTRVTENRRLAERRENEPPYFIQ